MKVKDLIKRLEHLDENLEVKVSGTEYHEGFFNYGYKRNSPEKLETIEVKTGEVIFNGGKEENNSYGVDKI